MDGWMILLGIGVGLYIAFKFIKGEMTFGEVMETLWNPNSDKLFPPKIFGWGRGFNFGLFLNSNAPIWKRGLSLAGLALFIYTLVVFGTMIDLAYKGQPLPDDFWYLLR